MKVRRQLKFTPMFQNKELLKFRNPLDDIWIPAEKHELISLH
jgi:hypothetical protein